MKYYFRRIICGVAIGLILFYCKSCEVHAASSSQYLYKADNVGVSASFDICKKLDTNYMCVDGFNINKVIDNEGSMVYRNSTNDIFLKSFSLVVDTTADDTHSIYLRQYFSLTSNLSSFFQISASDNNYNLRVNQVLSSVIITTANDTVCNIDTNIGATYPNSYLLPAFQVPSQCRGQYLKKLVLNWQSGFNFNGAIDNLIWPLIVPNPFNADTYISSNKNNTYLLAFLQKNVQFKYGALNTMMYSSDSGYYSGIFKAQNYTVIDENINANVTELEKQILLASLGGGGSSDNTGPSSPDSEQYDNIDDGFDGVANLVGTSVASYSFSDFLSALTQKPIAEILWIEQHFDQGGTFCPTLNIPLKVSKQNGTYQTDYYYQLPCMRDVYRSIPFVYPDDDATVYGWSIRTLWHIILKGYLMYLLVLTWLNIVKYTISRSQSEIEVIEL